MKRLLYPLMASAFITVMPFLLTFEKGQDIVRGIFGYEEFALLLLLIFVKEKIKGTNLFGRGSFVLFALIVALFSVAWIDLTNLLSLKKQSVGWYGVIPITTCLLAIVMIWKIKAFEFNTICFVLFLPRCDSCRAELTRSPCRGTALLGIRTTSAQLHPRRRYSLPLFRRRFLRDYAGCRPQYYQGSCRTHPQ